MGLYIVFKIEIGTQTLVQELGDAQDTHPDKDVIGWFHTHPGHGLFLSNSDLSSISFFTFSAMLIASVFGSYVISSVISL